CCCSCFCEASPARENWDVGLWRWWSRACGWRSRRKCWECCGGWGNLDALLGERPPRNGDRGAALRLARLRPRRGRRPGRLVVSKIQFVFAEAERAVEQHLDGAALGQNRVGAPRQQHAG